MHLHKYEKIWLIFGIVALIVFLSVVGVSAFYQGHTPSGGHMKIDPEKVNETAPFDDPGVHQKEDGTYEVVMVPRPLGITLVKFRFLQEKRSPLRSQVKMWSIVFPLLKRMSI